MVEYLQNGMKASLQTEGKDICLLMGTTGCGKSTMIYFLAGIKIQDIA